MKRSVLILILSYGMFVPGVTWFAAGIYLSDCFWLLILFQGQCADYLPYKEEFIVYGLLMIEVETEDLRNGFCRRHLKITNTKVKQSFDHWENRRVEGSSVFVLLAKTQHSMCDFRLPLASCQLHEPISFAQV